MSAKQNAQLQKLLDWHLEQAAECRESDQKTEREFHLWAVTTLSIEKQTR